MFQPILIWLISLTSIAGVIIRPFRLPEAVWAVAGAILLVVLQLISLAETWSGIGRGTDVYLFLFGMMLLAEVAREELLFDWLATKATRLAHGSAKRLFLLTYMVGIVVTAFLSNDATAVVLTPAVAAAVRAAKVHKPLPYLLICAFIANAASFLLPISNPANLVIYGKDIPPLLDWLPRYFLPSVLSIGITYLLLYRTQRSELQFPLETSIPIPRLSHTGRIAAWGIGATAIVLLACSALDIPLGLPTAITGAITSVIVLIVAKKKPGVIIRGVSWSVLPLVAGLFVIVEALNRTGLIRIISTFLQHVSARNMTGAVWGSGIGIALISNGMNNLPAGLIAAETVQSAHVPEMIRSAILIGVDLGPNLSVTGSLATILWLVALRREGQTISAWGFLKLGLVIMFPALLAALAAAFIH
ncbi:MAG TPA: arsenic transporter [Puia sp.]|jgi:arsenical pump membrane protein|nr:arsenic transporter [Puia sp.]